MPVTKFVQIHGLCAQLQLLLEAGTLTQAHQRTGERLLRRLESDISIVLAGPEAAGKHAVEQVLRSSELPQTSLRLVDWHDAFDLSQADVCIWCTTEFGPDEARIWQDAADWLKDHSFLVAVSVNGPEGGQLSEATLTSLEDIAAEEFYGLFPITIPQVTRAADVDALLREVAKLVQTGLRADADNAEIFVQRHQSKLPPERVIAPDSEAKAVLFVKPVPTQTPDLNVVYKEALGAMRSHLADLEPLMNAQEPAEMDDILTICAETTEAVADVLAGSESDDPVFACVLEETQTVADKVLLLSVEGGVAPAVAGVTCVLQLRREMELQIAC